MNDYRQVIKEKRLRLGLSQYSLAQKVNISQPFMNEIESGRKSPSLDVLQKICDMLQIEIIFRDKD